MFTSSPMIFLTIVVLPALSSPLDFCQFRTLSAQSLTHSMRMRISLSLRRAFLKIDSILTEAN